MKLPQLSKLSELFKRSSSASESKKQISRKQMIEEMKALIVTPPPTFADAAQQRKTKSQRKKPGVLRRIRNTVMTILLVIIVIVASVVTVLLTGIDTMLFPITLNGSVISVSAQPVPDARVIVEGQLVETNQLGQFQASGLTAGDYRIVIEAEGYDRLEEVISINRNNFTYQEEHTFTMEGNTTGYFSGKFIATDNPNYRFIGDFLEINGEIYDIGTDGTYQIDELTVGEYTINYKSPNYLDVSVTQQLNSGENRLDDIRLEPAGDIVGYTGDYITDLIVEGAELTISGVNQDQLTINEQGEFRFRDLEIGEKYSLRVRAEGYQTRFYDIDLRQGENRVSDFRLVPSGYVAYIQEVDGIEHVFVSEFDGNNAKQVTKDRNQPRQVKVSNDGETILIDGTVPGFSRTILAAPVSVGPVRNLIETVNRELLSDMTANLYAGMLTSIVEEEVDDEDQWSLKVVNVDGQGVVDVITTIGAIQDPHISNNGEYVYFYVADGPDQGFYRQTINTGNRSVVNTDQIEQIYDVSDSGERVLYSVTDSDTGVIELKFAEVAKGETVSVERRLEGFDYQFLDGSEKTLIFRKEVSDSMNIYSQNLDTKNTRRLTKNGNVEHVTQQNGLVYYFRADGMYVLDALNAVDGVLVSPNAINPATL